MDKSAKITAIDALLQFKAALIEFSEAVQLSLGEANSDVNRVQGWLRNDRFNYWKQQIRYRNNRLADAKSELMRAEISSSDTRASAVIERKMVEKWKRQVAEAEGKVQNIKKWSQKLEREMPIFKGRCQSLARIMDGDLPKALAKLDRLSTALEKYVKIAPPVGSSQAGQVSPDVPEPADDVDDGSPAEVTSTPN